MIEKKNIWRSDVTPYWLVVLYAGRSLVQQSYVMYVGYVILCVIALKTEAQTLA